MKDIRLLELHEFISRIAPNPEQVNDRALREAEALLWRAMQIIDESEVGKMRAELSRAWQSLYDEKLKRAQTNHTGAQGRSE